MREESDVDEPGLHEDLWEDEAECGDDVDEGGGGAAVVPRRPHEAARPPRQDGRRVHRARAQLVAKLVPVVGCNGENIDWLTGMISIRLMHA